jgi:hypothetical protein
MQHLDFLWNEYVKIFGGQLSKSQEVHAHVNFHCGAIAMFKFMMSTALNNEISQDEGAKFLNEIENECENYLDEMQSKVSSNNQKEH